VLSLLKTNNQMLFSQKCFVFVGPTVDMGLEWFSVNVSWMIVVLSITCFSMVFMHRIFGTEQTFARVAKMVAYTAGKSNV
jgi:hypothetical protein